MKDYCIDVLVIVPLDNLFTYRTNYKTKVGSVVKIPFGNNNEIVNGIVISRPYKPQKKFYIKKIISVENYERILSKRQIELLKWASKYYLVSLPKVFNSLFPKKIFEIKVEKVEKIYSNKENNNFNVNLVIEHSKNVLNYIILNLLQLKNQKLILSPNAFQTQYSYKILSKKINNIHIYDSKTSIKDKLIIWNKILQNEEIIILGSKSAVFLPFRNLDKIYVMYEHNFLYKENDKVIRYNSRDCAVVLSKIHKCNIDLISDSPSIESMYNTKKNKFKFFDNSKKLNLKTNLKKISIFNKLEKKLKNKIKGILTIEILEKIESNFNKKNKTIVFSPYSENVDIIYNTLKRVNQNFKIFSLSKQKSLTRNQLDEFYNQINDYDIIIGNYSVIDSLESFNYSLLVLVDPDKISSMINYKSNEIYFQLIFKVIKKVNYDKDKKLILQLINSSTEELKDNIRLDYFKIISKEIKERKVFGFSPFKRLISIEMSCQNIKESEEKGNMLFKKLSDKLKFCSLTNVGVINKRGEHIYKIYLKLDRVKKLNRNKEIIYELIKKIKKSKEYNKNLITIDVDP